MRSMWRRGLSVTGLLFLLPLSACTREVAWQEEVVLNTGARIDVQRKLTYQRSGSPGNPFEMGWGTKPGGELSFTWNGKVYVFSEHGRPLLVAISPRGVPVIVANAAIWQWDVRHNYGCKTPHYVQFEPDASGRVWTWPPGVEPWVIGLPANLLQLVPTPDQGSSRYTADQVRAIAKTDLSGSEDRFVAPKYQPDYCNPKGS